MRYGGDNVKLTEISIKGLYGIFDYEIPFFDNVTFIHGINFCYTFSRYYFALWYSCYTFNIIKGGQHNISHEKLCTRTTKKRRK